jgi:hypothetical protein
MAVPIELWQAQALRIGDVIYVLGYYEKDGSPQRFIVINKPKRWKRNGERVEVSLARGSERIIMTELCLEEFSLDAPDPIRLVKIQTKYTLALTLLTKR